MNFPDDLLPSSLVFIAHLVWALVLIGACWRAPWSQLRHSHRQHVFLGAIVALLLLWNFNAGVTPGLGFHFLGVTVFTLMFGWSLGVIGISLVILGVTLNGIGGLEAMSINALLLGVLPVSVSYAIYGLVHRHLPRNVYIYVFIYIFLCGFLAAIVAAGAAVLAIVGVLVMTDTYTLARITQEYLPFLPLYLFPEGLLNGMLTTVFTVLRPHWLMTFDEESYLKIDRD